MTEYAALRSGGRPWRTLAGVGATLALVTAAIVASPGSIRPGELGFAPHAPDWSVLERQSLAIQVHVGAAAAAFVLGLVQLLGPKGTMPHRIVGWSWVLVMLTAAISSIFIRQLNHGMFSFIHILTGLALVSLPMLVYAARKGDIAAHRKHATGLFAGAVLLAGALAFLPGRVMWELVLG